MAVLGLSLVDGRLVVSRLPNTADILLLAAATHTVPRVAPVVPYWLAHLSICRILLVCSLAH